MLTAAVAAATETKNISNMDELKAALQSSGDLNLNVTREIVVSDSLSKLGSTYITLGSGKKLLNLAGYKVEVNATGAGSFDFIHIPAGAELIVMDSSENETGKLWADGDMVFRDYGGLPYYYNSDVRYRNTIVVNGGSFTLLGGEIEAGRAKETWVYNGQKVEKWFQQLNYALQGGVLAWAIGVRFDGNAY
ncbi:MAG: hypothetical protein IJU41_10075 [Clostridia bacterium]|nr:hypothetical protein [Clostridia bacterium]